MSDFPIGRSPTPTAPFASGMFPVKSIQISSVDLSIARYAAAIVNGVSQQLLDDFTSDSIDSKTSQIGPDEEREASQWCLHNWAGPVSILRDWVDYLVKIPRQVVEFQQKAVTLIMRADPVYVGNKSWPTAHEAILSMGEIVLGVWEDSVVDFFAKNAPNSKLVDRKSDLAVEVAYRLWQGLNKVRQERSPPRDLDGRIQQEYIAACELLKRELASNNASLAGQAPEGNEHVADGHGLVLSGGDARGKIMKGGVAKEASRKRRDDEVYKRRLRDAEIYNEWQRAREAGIQKTDFAASKRMTLKALNRLLDRTSRYRARGADN